MKREQGSEAPRCYLCDSDDSAVSDIQQCLPVKVSELASGNVVGSAGSALEQITGVEPASSVWETEVITAILYLHISILPHCREKCKGQNKKIGSPF